jgi:hypothetical protein
MKKLTIEYIKKYSNENDTICHDNIYINSHHKLKFECNKGHIYFKNFSHFKNQKCPVCSGKRKKTIEEINEYCNKENYKCISKEYKNKIQKLDFICPKNHTFKMSWNDYRMGNRCKECNIENIKMNFRYIVDLALNNNMICLSKIEDYKNELTKLKFKCFNNHTFYKSYIVLNQDKKCKQCHINNNFGKNTTNWNPNREEVSLNKRIRNTFSKSWVTKNMKDDPNYNDFLLNPKDYVIDHIFPIKAFCKYMLENNIDEKIIKPIANHRNNLQILNKDINRNKTDRYNKEVFINYINEHSFIKNYIYS